MDLSFLKSALQVKKEALLILDEESINELKDIFDLIEHKKSKGNLFLEFYDFKMSIKSRLKLEELGFIVHQEEIQERQSSSIKIKISWDV